MLRFARTSRRKEVSVEKKKILIYGLVSVFAIFVLLASFGGGAAAGVIWARSHPQHAYSETPPTPAPEVKSAAPSEDLQTLFKPFWEAWQLVHDQYVDQPVDDTKLMEGAIQGMLASLGDPHTSYMDPDQYLQANMEMEGEYDGIGAWVDSSGDYLTIVSPMADSPAEKAGLKPGDRIIAVDGEDITDLDPELVIRRVLGPAGTTVTLTVLREGSDEPLDFEVTRAHITIPSVEGKMLDDGIAYVHIYTFGANTGSELDKILEDLMAQNPSGIIVDLRYNGGGYLQTAIDVASEFLPKGKVVLYEEYGDGTRDVHKTHDGGRVLDIPMVILVNEGTASASEVVSGALQDYGRAQLVGVTTYGKGSVQIWTPLSDEQGAVRVTIARWLTPNERQIDKVGLEPDVVAEMTEEDYQNGEDPQLDKAIEVLKEAIKNASSP
jgi:carboxyl-terminal processing protease